MASWGLCRWPLDLVKFGNHFANNGLKVMKQATATVALVSTQDQKSTATLSKGKSMMLAVMMRMYNRTTEIAQTLRFVSSARLAEGMGM